MMNVEPTREHRWLQQLLGEWSYEHQCPEEPGKEPMKLTGTERVRSLGDLWIIAEGQGEMPGGGTAYTALTIGYDPARKRFVGTWIGSMMANMWVYEGELNAAGTTLTLNTEGPAMGPQGPIEGKTARYREVIEIKSPDLRTFTSEMQSEDGTWAQIMHAPYRRTK